jgi:hypothetical protein
MRLEKTSVNSANPVATTTKMAMGMYDESIRMNEGAESRAPGGKAVGL